MRATRGWLFGAAPDLLLGCGGGYALVLGVLWLAPGTLQSILPLGLLPLLVLVTGIPHYGATLVRVYERRQERDAYRFFTVWLTLAVYAWFVLGVYHLAIGSWLVTLYLTWSPWHYTGQNYGIAVMFLRRRQVSLDRSTQRWLYASYLCSYAIVFLGIHAALGDVPEYGSNFAAQSSYQLQPLGIPPAVYTLCTALAAGGYLLSSAVAWLRLGRDAGWRDLGPAVALSGLQAVWFAMPGLARALGVLEQSGPFAYGLEIYGLMWIAVGHAVQYLWITTYYAQRDGLGKRAGPYLAKALLAGCAIWGLPAFLFAPDLLGVRSFDAGLALLVAAAVNVHHFLLDGAIWKLRDGPVARILVRSRPEAHETAAAFEADGLAPWVRGAVAAVGIAYALSTVVGTWEAEFGVRRASKQADYERISLAADRLRWVGRDHPAVRYDLGMHALEQGDLDAAERDLSRSLEIGATPDAWVALGVVAERRERWSEALQAFDAALELDADHLAALTRSASILMRNGERRTARERIERASRLAPEREGLKKWLDQLSSRGDTGGSAGST